MDKFLERAKKFTKAAVPDSILDPAYGGFLDAKAEFARGAAKPMSELPDWLEALQSQPAPTDLAGSLTSGWLRAQIAELAGPDLTSYFFVEQADMAPSVVAPPASYLGLINTVIAISLRSNLQLAYVSANKRPVFETNYGKLIRDLEALPNAEIRLFSDAEEFTFFIEGWEIVDDVLVGQRFNPLTIKIYLESATAKEFLAKPGADLDELYGLPNAEDVTFDVDVVYTWVDLEDPDWQQMLAASHTEVASATNDADGAIQDGIDVDRFVSRDELRYSLRSLLKYAPWVRTIWIVSNCRAPDWLDVANERIRWVAHEEIIEAENLPTFNSHAIETSIHRIEGLSENFLYFNDDLFFLRPINKTDFFLPNGIAKVHLEPFGGVQGEVNEADPIYVNAARNGQALLEGEFAKTVTKLHTHSPQSARVSVMQACEATFPEAYASTRSHKFRSPADISPTSFLYPNYAYLTGNAVTDYSSVALVNHRRPYGEIFERFLAGMGEGEEQNLPLVLCINDGGGSSQDESWNTAIVDFMQAAFPEPSEVETT